MELKKNQNDVFVENRGSDNYLFSELRKVHRQGIISDDEFRSLRVLIDDASARKVLKGIMTSSPASECYRHSGNN